MLVVQPGPKTIYLTLPVNVPPGTGIWVPDGLEGVPNVTCEATIASL